MANKIIRKEKEVIVDEIAAKLKDSKGAVLVEYRGLTVAQVSDLRDQLRAEGVEMVVYKNTLAKLAAEKAGFNELGSHLTGPNAFAFGMEDEVAAARILAEFSKENEALKLKAGTLEGKVIGIDVVNDLASIPGREGLLTQLAAGLLMPVKEVAIGLNMLEEEHVAK